MSWQTDPYWTQALEVAKALNPKHCNILVPEEFLSYRPEFYPMKQGRQLSPRVITAFVIPKDQLGHIPRECLEEHRFQLFSCIFANEVFVIYSTLPENVPSHGDIPVHNASFLAEREEYLRRPLTDPLPYLLDTQDNRILKSLFPHKNYLMEQFMDLSQAPSLLQHAVTKYCVQEVRLELSAFCNRSCAYCPVSFLDRKNPDTRMPREVLEQCVQDLVDLDFDGQVWFCLFNEPLYDRDYLLSVLSYVAQELPKSYIKIVSNGDYLTEEYFQELCSYHLDELTISVHYDGVWQEETQRNRFLQILSRIGLTEEGIWDSEPGRLIFTPNPIQYASSSLKRFSLRSEDFLVHGMDRGGVLSSGVLQVEHLDHCDAPMTQVNISYDGTMVPCCNMCSDVPSIRPYAYGTVLQDGNLSSIYTSKKAAHFRSLLFAPIAGGGGNIRPPAKPAVWENMTTMTGSIEVMIA